MSGLSKWEGLTPGNPGILGYLLLGLWASKSRPVQAIRLTPGNLGPIFGEKSSGRKTLRFPYPLSSPAEIAGTSLGVRLHVFCQSETAS